MRSGSETVSNGDDKWCGRESGSDNDEEAVARVDSILTEADWWVEWVG